MGNTHICHQKWNILGRSHQKWCPADTWGVWSWRSAGKEMCFFTVCVFIAVFNSRTWYFNHSRTVQTLS